MADTGNTNTFKIFMGKYPTTENRFVMLTILNDVQFMDDYTADETGKLTTLPPECRPNKALKILVPIQRSESRVSQQIEVVTDITTTDSNIVTGGSNSTLNYVESTTSETHKAITNIEPIFNTGIINSIGNGIGEANGLKLSEDVFTTLTESTTKSADVVSALTTGTVKGVDNVKKTTISIGTDEETLPYGAVTINPDGNVIGESNSTYSMNGVSFNISGNFYR